MTKSWYLPDEPLEINKLKLFINICLQIWQTLTLLSMSNIQNIVHVRDQGKFITHHVPVLSAKRWNRLQCTQAYQHWTAKAGTVVRNMPHVISTCWLWVRFSGVANSSLHHRNQWVMTNATCPRTVPALLHPFMAPVYHLMRVPFSKRMHHVTCIISCWIPLEHICDAVKQDNGNSADDKSSEIRG